MCCGHYVTRGVAQEQSAGRLNFILREPLGKQHNGEQGCCILSPVHKMKGDVVPLFEVTMIYKSLDERLGDRPFIFQKLKSLRTLTNK